MNMFLINDVNQLLLRTSFVAPFNAASARDATGLSNAKQDMFRKEKFEKNFTKPHASLAYTRNQGCSG